MSAPYFFLIQQGLNLLHLAVLHHKSVPLAPEVTKELGGVEVKVQGLGELAGGIGNETDLQIKLSIGDSMVQDD